MDGLAPGSGEHVIVGAAPLGADPQPLLGLALAVIPEYLHGLGVDADGAGSAALGRSLDALSGDDGGRAGDADLSEVEVDVAPAEIEQFAATSAGICGEAVEGEQAVLAGRVEECPELAGYPTRAGSERVLRGRLARSTGFDGRSWSTTTASRNAFRSTAWTYSTVRGDRPALFWPPLIARSR
jgi:hypothetical protein